MEEIHVYMRIYGIVQGVGFRAFAVYHAKRLGIKGYVRNLSDGSVEIVAEGSRTSIELFIDIVKRGSPFALVKRIDIRYSDNIEGFTSFSIL